MNCFLVILLSSQLSVSVQALTCEGCDTADDSSTLLQSRVQTFIDGDMKHTRDVGSVRTVEDVSKLFEDILQTEQAGNTSRDMSGLAVIKEIIEMTLMPGLLKAHNDTKYLLEDAQKKVQECVDKIGTDSAKVDAKSDVTSTAKNTHSLCRAEEAAKAKTMKADCDALDSFLQNLDRDCTVPPKTVDSVSSYLTTGLKWFQENSDEFIEKNKSCNISATLHNAEKTQCIEDQKAFESHFCQYREDLTALKAASDLCYEETSAIFNDIKEKAIEAVPRWKAEYKSLKKIECYLDVWLNDKNPKTVDKLKPPKCEADTIADKESMELEPYPVLPPEPLIDVSPVADYPGSKSFFGTHYGDLEADPSEVTPCLDVDDGEDTTTTTTFVLEALWSQQASAQCGSTLSENNAANAAGVPMLTPNRHENSMLKDYKKGSITLAACKAKCLETPFCRGIEVASTSANDGNTAGCSLMYSGTFGGKWSGSCWSFTIGGSIPDITAGPAKDLLQVFKWSQQTPAGLKWSQQTSAQCGSTTSENNAANAAGVPMLTPNRHENSMLKDYKKGSITLAACKAKCLETPFCRGIEVASTSADDGNTAGCSLMYSGTFGGKWSGSCWSFTIDGSIPDITAGSAKEILRGLKWSQQASAQCGSTLSENNAANAAGVPMLTPNRHENSMLKDYNQGSITLAACKAKCLETPFCRGIEVASTSANDGNTAGCSLMYSGTFGGKWSGSCWSFTIDGSIPDITAGSANDLLR